MDFGGMLKKAQEMQQKMMEAKASLKNLHLPFLNTSLSCSLIRLRLNEINETHSPTLVFLKLKLRKMF